MSKRNHQPYKLHSVTLSKLPDGEYADGGNLYLRVVGNSRTWLIRYKRPSGSRTRLGIGSLYSVSLSEARQKAREVLIQVRHPVNPIDPVIQRRNTRAAKSMVAATRMSFKQCATALIETKSQEWRHAKSEQQWTNTLTSYVYPLIGDIPVAEVNTTMIVKCLTPIWLKTNETARRLQGRIAAVLDWATAHGFREGNNPARWKGHLDKLLADPTKVQKRKHFAALPYAEIGVFMSELRKCGGVGARALEFAILTAARSGEVRGAEWTEFDMQLAVWTIPAERMKAGREHRVPLSKAALLVLRALPEVKGCNYVFPSAKANTSLSDMTLTAVLRRLNRTDITVHGFRSTFRDWAAECTSFSREVAEMALAHSIPNAVEAAYRRGDLFLKRQLLMTEWANVCDKLPSDKKDSVIDFPEGVVNAN